MLTDSHVVVRSKTEGCGIPLLTFPPGVTSYRAVASHCRPIPPLTGRLYHTRPPSLATGLQVCSLSSVVSLLAPASTATVETQVAVSRVSPVMLFVEHTHLPLPPQTPDPGHHPSVLHSWSPVNVQHACEHSHRGTTLHDSLEPHQVARLKGGSFLFTAPASGGGRLVPTGSAAPFAPTPGSQPTAAPSLLPPPVFRVCAWFNCYSSFRACTHPSVHEGLPPHAHLPGTILPTQPLPSGITHLLSCPKPGKSASSLAVTLCYAPCSNVDQRYLATCQMSHSQMDRRPPWCV